MEIASSNGKTKWKVINEGLLLNKTVGNISEISVDGSLETNKENLPKEEDTSVRSPTYYNSLLCYFSYVYLFPHCSIPN